MAADSRDLLIPAVFLFLRTDIVPSPAVFPFVLIRVHQPVSHGHKVIKIVRFPRIGGKNAETRADIADPGFLPVNPFNIAVYIAETLSK